jgi:hypothetical protein
MSRRPITLVLPYYRNAEMLGEQFELMARLPADVKGAIQLIVADDGTPADAVSAEAVCLPWVGKDGFNGMGIADFQLFRVDVDVRWNWLTCRNIGVHHAKTEWVLLTDIDHVVPEPTWRRLQELKLNPRNVYRFSRVDAPELTPYKPHPNSWLMTKAKFEETGGYDERFSGFYGTDGEFRDRVRSKASEIVMLENPLVRYPREVIADASTLAYGRKEKQDHDGVTRIRAEIARDGGPTRRLSFPYHRVV